VTIAHREAKVGERRGLVEIVLADEAIESELSGAIDRHFSESWSALPLGLLDLRHVTATDVSARLIREAASRAEKHVDPRLESGKFAIIAPRDFLFGMARMYEILRSDSSAEVRVFRDRLEALRQSGALTGHRAPVFCLPSIAEKLHGSYKRRSRLASARICIRARG
jgi:hypothetical protein